MAELIQQPRWVDTWILILLISVICAAAFLASAVGQQALVDERVRVIESFGGRVDDAQYEELEAHPPLAAYVTSGSRMLLTPIATLVVAAVCWATARADGRNRARFAHALAIVVHASVVLALGQVIATPVNYIRESLTSPLNLAAILPLIEDGSIAARFFGALDVFTVWWLALIGIGLSTLTGRRARRYVSALGAAYLGFAAIVAAVIAAVGGT